MKKWLFTMLMMTGLASGYAQPLDAINFKHLYDPSQPFHLQTKAVRYSDHWLIIYHIEFQDTLVKANELSVEWQLRESATKDQFTKLDSTYNITWQSGKSGINGTITLPTSQNTMILAAKLTDLSFKKTQWYFTTLDTAFPVNNFFREVKDFSVISPGTHELYDTTGNWFVSYYSDNFPAAVPPFAENQAKVSREMVVDSVYSFPANKPVSFSQNGLYLVQKDTLAAEGFSFRVENDYPKYTKVKNLGPPLVYICTRQEFDKIEQSKGDKTIFDRTVLTLANNNTENARHLIRNYFRRVALANKYFSSYKEGWKTDRGMIYIIFGLPDDVNKTDRDEVWTYSNPSFNVSFEFSRSSSVFDPDNYVLIRDTKFQKIWYEVVDQWRKAKL